MFIELFIGHLGDSLEHLLHVSVEACLHVRATFLWGLNQKERAYNVSLLAMPGENDVAQLLDSAQLVECWLVQEL